jgi:F-type H+-transporting ATPase subunit beta
MLGELLDGQALPEPVERRPIHRPVASLVVPRQPMRFLETGIKVIDLLAPVAGAGITGIIGGAGVGKSILLHELMNAMTRKRGGVVAFAGVGERTREGNDLWLALRQSGTLANSVLVMGQMSDPPGTRFRAALTALTMAEYFRDVQDREVMFVVDSISRHLQAGCEVSSLMGRLPSEMGYQPTLAHDLAMLEARLTAPTWLGITSVQAMYVPADDMTDPMVAQAFVHLDTSILLTRARAAHGLYPPVDPLGSSSLLLEPAYIGDRHYQVAKLVKQTLERRRELEDIICMLGIEQLRSEDQQTVRRARRLERFLTQPFFVTESLTGWPGQHVPLRETLAGCEAILEGEFDNAESAGSK